MTRDRPGLHSPFGFVVDLMKQPLWIRIWVPYLVAINLLSLLFWGEPQSRVILVVFILSSMLMMVLYARFGFEKILGLGHILWIPLLAYLLMSIPAAAGTFKLYLAVLAASIAVSLAFDIVDVWTYVRGGGGQNGAGA